MRGLNDNVIKEIICNKGVEYQKLREIINGIQNLNGHELFLAIRDDYINLYYKGANVVKIEFYKNGQIKEITTHNKYWNGTGTGYKTVSLTELDNIINNIEKYLANENKMEKKWQQATIMRNNNEANPDWFLIDMEYIMERKNNGEKNYGRFDIVGISNNTEVPIVGLIEVKVDTDAFSGSGDDTSNLKTLKPISYDTNNAQRLGSGILGHFSDFIRYCNDKKYIAKDCETIGRFNVLQKEIVNILENYKELGLYSSVVPSLLEKIKKYGFRNVPDILFLLFGNQKSQNDIEEQFKRYVGTLKKGRVPNNTIVNTWDPVILDKYNKNSSALQLKYLIKIGEPQDVILSGCPINGAKNIFL